jgi:hypothetical protein
MEPRHTVKILAIVLFCVGFAITAAAFSLDLSHEYASFVHLLAAAVFLGALFAWRRGKTGPNA